MLSFSRRAFFRAGLGAAAGVLAIGADATVWEPNRPRVERVEIPLRRLPAAWDGFRVVQLSDLHYDDYFSVIPLRASLDIIKDLQPDLIVLTGDFVTAPEFRKRHFDPVKVATSIAEPCAQLLAQLHARMGMFAVLGNHDASCAPSRIAEILKARGITVLRNQASPLEQQGSRLWLVGVDDVMEGLDDIALAMKRVPPDEPALLLVHEPDFALTAAHYPVDLQMSGHSHGGQVRVPFIGAPWLPPFGRKFPMGLYNVDNLTLYTNVGLGTIRIPVRWNCPPEITLFTLRAGSSPSGGKTLES